jgi:hypothetical protein
MGGLKMAKIGFGKKMAKSVFGNTREFARRVEYLNKRACDFENELEFEDYTVYGEAVGSDHWLAMNLMWLVEAFQDGDENGCSCECGIEA